MNIQPPETFSLDERAQRILDVALSLFVHYGYDKTTLTDIAAEANISKSTFYLYWKSKEELFRALLARDTFHMFEEWLQRVQDDPQGGTLYSLYKHSFRTLTAHPLILALYTRENKVLGDFLRRYGSAAYTQLYLLNRVFIQHLQAVELIRPDLEVDVVNHILVSISVGLATIGELVQEQDTPSFEKVAETLAEMVERALAPEHAGNPDPGKRALQSFIEQLQGRFSSPKA